jgi:hypothetical protein
MFMVTPYQVTDETIIFTLQNWFSEIKNTFCPFSGWSGPSILSAGSVQDKSRHPTGCEWARTEPVRFMRIIKAWVAVVLGKNTDWLCLKLDRGARYCVSLSHLGKTSNSPDFGPG